MADRNNLHIAVDREACVGHGRCYALAPDIFEPDDEGFSTVVDDADNEQLQDELDQAVRNCPERAISVSNGA